MPENFRKFANYYRRTIKEPLLPRWIEISNTKFVKRKRFGGEGLRFPTDSDLSEKVCVKKKFQIFSVSLYNSLREKVLHCAHMSKYSSIIRQTFSAIPY